MGFVELAVCLLVAAAGTVWRGVGGGGQFVFPLLLVGAADGARGRGYCWLVRVQETVAVLARDGWAASAISVSRLSVILSQRSASDSVSRSLAYTRMTRSCNAAPPSVASQSPTTVDSRVGVRSSSSVGNSPLYLTVPPEALVRRRLSSMAFLSS